MFNLSGKEESINFEGFEFKYVLKNRAFDTNHLIVVFSGYGGTSDFNYDFLGSLKTNRAYVLWIKDDFYNNNRATYYVDPVSSNNKTLEKAITKFIESTLDFLSIARENCTLLGCSKGGASALFYGIKYNFKNIVVSAPTLLIGSSVAGIIPKGPLKPPAKFLLGDDISNESIEKLDSIIINEIENDLEYNKNIYLLSSKADNRYLGQIKPYLGYFHKYYNFNFIESQSVLVRTHQEVTSYNAPLILSILGCLTFNLTASFKNSIIYGDKPTKLIDATKEPVLKVDRLDFDNNGFFYPEGVFFLRGIPCANYSDLKYILKLKSKKDDYEVVLAKGNNKKISSIYYKDAFINYDKSFFCTKQHQGLDLSHMNCGVYQLFIQIIMRTGETCEIPILAMENIKNIKNISSSDKFIQSVYSDSQKVFYSKVEI